MRTSTTTAILSALALLAAAPAQAQDIACEKRGDLAGRCFAVTGDLRLYDGTPSARIVHTGLRRTLGVTVLMRDDDETFAAPEAVRREASFDRFLHGRFGVCPLEKSRAGRMQNVCIASATRLRVLR